jgi:hypothetical protein
MKDFEMTAALSYAARRLAASMVAFGILALLLGGASQSDPREHAALRTAAPAQYESPVLATCNGTEFANSLKRAELMSLCWRLLTQTAVLRLSACIAWLDATQVSDWRAAQLLFNQVLD